jgi:tetratricopeptide (TPR) repeat protein
LRRAAGFATAIFLIISAPAPARAASPLEAGIRRGLRATAAGGYEEALREFEGVVKKAPGDPRGYFFLASVYSILAGHFEDPPFREGFEKNAARAAALAEERIKAAPKDAEAYLLGGLAAGMRALAASRRKSYVRALIRSLKTKRYLERAIALNPKLEDAYYGLGLYYFWRTRAKWLRDLAPLLGDTGDTGIRYMRRAARGGRWLRDLARIELVYAFYADNKFADARVVLAGLIGDYPDQPHYRFAHAEGYFVKKKYKRARAMFRRLRGRFRHIEGRVEGFYADYAEWRIARCDYRLGDKEAARRGAERVAAKPDLGSPLIRRVRKAAADLVHLIDSEEYIADRFPVSPQKK